MKYKDSQSKQITNILICGNTTLLEENTVNYVSRFYNVVIAGEGPDYGIKNKKVHCYPDKPSTEKFSQICFANSPDVVWYISGYADGGNGYADEVKMVERLMKDCQVSDVEEVVVISSVNSLNYVNTGMVNVYGQEKYDNEIDLCCAQNERLMKYLADKYDLKLILFRAPYIAKSVNDTNFLGKVFEAARSGVQYRAAYSRNQYIDFISMNNLVELLVAVSEEYMDLAGDYTVYSGFSHNYGELAKAVRKKVENFDMEFEDYTNHFDSDMLESAGRSLRKAYGFVATDDVIEQIPDLYTAFEKQEVAKNRPFNKIRTFLEKREESALKYIELVVFFVVIQFLLQFTSNSVYFKFVDLRLFFVVIMAITHGMQTGLFAAILMCISLVFSYKDIGVTGTMLFYNLDYWFSFVIYLITGSIVGYFKSVNDEKAQFAEEENAVLQDKYLFLNNVYQQVIDNKSEYKRQILGYQDSFGKIFEAVENLNGSVAADIFMNGVETLENILENHSIAIYAMDDYQNYARLQACSKEMSAKLNKSMRIGSGSLFYKALLKEELWKNTDFNDELPMYAFGIVENGKVRVIIALYEADSSQLGLYYSNLFSILCSLIRVSFVRAYEYQNAIGDDKYYPNTEILKPDYFAEVLDIQMKMEEAGMASYVLLKFESTNREELTKSLSGIIRHSDVLGEFNDGKIYLMLTQVTKNNIAIVTNRLDEKELKYEIIGG